MLLLSCDPTPLQTSERALMPIEVQDKQMLAGIADGNGAALCQLDLSVTAFGTYRVILLKRRRQQSEAVAVFRDRFPDAPNQMSVRREFPAWDDLLKPIHDLVELGYEDGDFDHSRH